MEVPPEMFPGSLFILPIRDGNHLVFAAEKVAVLLFILPIRDGNGFCIHLQLEDGGTFYTSYKGWKRPLFLSLPRPRAPFYTSYKGWKLRVVCYKIPCSSSFYTSYKGWKRKRFPDPTNGMISFYTSYKGWKPDLLEIPYFGPEAFLYFL